MNPTKPELGQLTGFPINRVDRQCHEGDPSEVLAAGMDVYVPKPNVVAELLPRTEIARGANWPAGNRIEEGPTTECAKNAKVWDRPGIIGRVGATMRSGGVKPCWNLPVPKAASLPRIRCAPPRLQFPAMAAGTP